MTTRFWTTPEESLRKLKSDLWQARYNLLRRAPSNVRGDLESYRQCRNRMESRGWLDRVAERILEIAQPIPDSLNGWGPPRGWCPICGDGSSGPYDTGFALPEGLRRHLVGYGRSNQCVFTETAEQLAREAWDEKFAESELAEEQELVRNIASRRASETLFQISPFGKPSLSDEIGYGYQTRGPEELEFAIKRLNELGFVDTLNENVRSWIDERPSWVVYADPRPNGRISLAVWRKPLPKKQPRNEYKLRISYFDIMDAWKHDLKRKYESRLPPQDS